MSHWTHSSQNLVTSEGPTHFPSMCQGILAGNHYTGMTGHNWKIPAESRTCAYKVSNAFREGFAPVTSWISSIKFDASCSEPSSPSSQKDVIITSARVLTSHLMTVRPRK